MLVLVIPRSGTCLPGEVLEVSTSATTHSTNDMQQNTSLLEGSLNYRDTRNRWLYVGLLCEAKAPEIHPQTFPLGSVCNLAGDPGWCQAPLTFHFNLAV